MSSQVSSSGTMEHALAILGQKNLWNWSDTIQKFGKQDAKFKAVTPKFLYHLIEESEKLGGSVLDHFWNQLGVCNEQLKENIENLKVEAFVSAQRSFKVLFWGLDPESINFDPVLAMSAEFFTHLGVAFMNPGGQTSGSSTAFSVNEVTNEDANKLLQQVNEHQDSGRQSQELLKALSFKHDGQFCLLTHKQFIPFDNDGFYPSVAHIIPDSVGKRQETLDSIAMFAGAATRDDMGHLNKIGNVMNMQLDAHSIYNKLRWGIEAKESKHEEVKYPFRLIPSPTSPNARAPGPIALREGDEFQFGNGPDGKEIDKPIPSFCNLQLAVARVLEMSAAADIILEWKDDASDDGCFPLFIASEEYCHMLDAKLFLSGRAVATY